MSTRVNMGKFPENALAILRETSAPFEKTDWWKEGYGFFGELYYRGDHSCEGYLDALPMTVPERSAHDAEGIVQLLGLLPGACLLDAPCGYGRHAIELSARGFAVTGLDINRYFLARAEEAALARNVAPILLCQDMRTLDYETAFDAVLNLCYSFGFFASDEENMRVLRNFYRALKPGGAYLMNTDVNMPRVRKGVYKFNEVRDLEQKGTLSIAERYDPQTLRMNGVWTVQLPDGQIQRSDYSVRVFEVSEFQRWCFTAGFKSCEVFSSWAGASYSEDAEEIYFVAYK